MGRAYPPPGRKAQVVVRTARAVNVNMNARIHPARRRAPAFGIYLPVRHCECSAAIHEGVVPPIAAVVMEASLASWIAASPAAHRNDERG
ncbi:hypothetical protein EB810_05935 [Altererythrobacter sp. FM1]|nr:hypothetical protein EB810_05935 [Altererythrobacter sp. FM1]